MKYSFPIPLIFIALAAYGERSALPQELTTFSADALSAKMWDASRLNTDNPKTRCFVDLADNGLITWDVEGDAEHYLLRGDSVVFRGYTRSVDQSALVDTLDSKRVVVSFLDQIIDTLDFDFTRNISFGRFVFAPGDTVDARLVDEVRIYSADSARSCSERYLSWYAGDEVLPFALQVQRMGWTEPRLFVSEWNPLRFDKSKKSQTEENIRVTLENASVTVSSQYINVAVGALPGYTCECAVVDPAGTCCYSEGISLETSASFSIPVTGLPKGTYLLSLTIQATKPITERRIINL